MINTLIVAIGGALGAAARYMASLVPVKEPFAFPLKTFLVNVIGCFCIGLIAAVVAKHSVSPRLVLFFKTGVCGGFTTFSTFTLETDVLLKSGQVGIAATYVVLSVAVGVVLIFAAHVLVGK